MSPGCIEPPGRRPRPTALFATSDKTGVVELARGLDALGWEIFATSGTASHVAAAGIAARDASELGGLPPLLRGRLKTLHAPVFGGLLLRPGDAGDEEEMRQLGFRRIELLACTFYPFEDAASGAARADPLELIDVGGPAMLRAAAKNHDFVIPLASPGDYPATLAALQNADGNPAGVAPAFRRRLAARAFARTAHYDRSIAEWFESGEAG